jgi:SAM-dependent methyltransferase
MPLADRPPEPEALPPTPDQLQSLGLRAYEALAPLYEQHWGAAFLREATGLYEQLLASHLAANSRVLDLCCGAGHFAHWLSAQGRRVVGVDAAPSIIALARLRAPGEEFHVADMRSFRLPVVFDAAVCFYNSVNQVLTPEGLRAVFESVHQHLRPGARFLFDLVLEEGYARSWHADEVLAVGERTCELAYRYDPSAQLASCRATLRSAEGEAAETWEFCQRPHELATVIESLRQAGFESVEQHAVGGSNPPGGRLALVAIRAAESTAGERRSQSAAQR